MKVNNAGNAVVWRADDDSGAEDFTDLGDTPSAIGLNRVVVGNGTGNALAFDLIRDFHIGANAVETTHIRNANVTSAKLAANVIAANPGGAGLTALNTITISGTDYELGGGSSNVARTSLDLGDTPSSLGSAFQIVAVNAGGNALVFANTPAHNFLALGDTPSAFGDVGQVLKVNNAQNALVWSADSGAENFTDLGDTPSSIGQNRVVVGNGTGNALAFDQIRDFHIANNAVETAHIRDDNVTSAKLANNVLEANPAFTSATSLTGIRIHNATFTVGGGGAASDFTDLGDTPSALGTAGQVVKVNTAGDALIFAADDTGGGGGGGGASDFVDLDDTPSSITANRLVAGNGAGDALDIHSS